MLASYVARPFMGATLMPTLGGADKSASYKPILAQNRKAWHSYSIEDQIEAGLVLTGPEVKSIKAGQVSLNGAYVSIRGGEAWLRNAYIARYQQASNLESYNESQDRKLLLHKSELQTLSSRLNEKGATLVPLELYTNKNRIKLKLGLVRGKKQFDKREVVKRKETKRKIEREIRLRI